MMASVLSTENARVAVSNVRQKIAEIVVLKLKMYIVVLSYWNLLVLIVVLLLRSMCSVYLCLLWVCMLTAKS